MKGLLFTSFGTSHADTRARTIDAVEAKLRSEFSDMAFYSAWTSGRIVAKVKAERGEQHDTLDEALARLTADGVNDLAVATTCLMHGGEMAKIAHAVGQWAEGGKRATCIAEPLLSTADDRATVARAICDEFADLTNDDALLLMGHGSTEKAAVEHEEGDSNAVFAQIQDEMLALGRQNFFVATVEGTPTLDDALALLEARKPKRVWLAPLMIVAGDHAKNDLAGEGDDSWANVLRARGYEVEVALKGLGEYPAIHDLVCEHVRDILVLREVSLRG